MKQRLKRIFGLLFILVNIAALAIVSSTNSKYLKEDNIAYDTSMYKFTPTMNVAYVSTTNDGVNLFDNYRVSFSRNNMTYPGESDLYTFYARINGIVNTCTTGIAEQYKSSTDTGMGTIPVGDSTTVINIDVSCNITEYADGTPIYFHAEEKIGNDTPLLIGNSTAYISNYDLYSEILDRIQNGTEFDPYDSSIRHKMLTYLSSSIVSNMDLHNGYQLKGLTYTMVPHNATFDPNFVGYSVTMSDYSPLSYIAATYYSSMDNLEDDFDYYLRTYLKYDSTMIEKAKAFVLFKTNASNLEDGIQVVLTSISSPVTGLTRDLSTYSNLTGLKVNDESFTYAVKVKYGLDNYFIANAELSTNGRYNSIAPLFGYNVLVNNDTLRTSFGSVAADTSVLYVLNDPDTNSKLLVNIYQRVDTLADGENTFDTTHNYMRVMKLEEGATIKISNNTTFSYYDLNDGVTTLSNLNDIVDAINTYSGYTLTLQETGEDYITYTLTNN